jgi:hypothetical protein
MQGSKRSVKVPRALSLAFLLVAAFSSFSPAQSLTAKHDREAVDKSATMSNLAENRQKLENYKGKNGIVSMKTVVLGGDFRVTTVIPFKGNLADYRRLEIARPISLVGGALTSQVSDHQLERLKSQLEEKRIFESVTVIDTYMAADQVQLQKPIRDTSNNTGVQELDSLDSPICSFTDMEARDSRRLRQDNGAEGLLDLTLVTVIEVLDYAKGNRLKQALPLDLGKSILTVRLRYYDKDSGKEIGRQIVSGKSGGSSLLGPISPRDALSGVADGFVDQITRRVVAAEK